MSKIFCIPKQFISKLQEGVKNGDFDVVKLIELGSSEKRRAVFEKYLPKAEAKFANTKLERAIALGTKKSLEEFARDVFEGGKEKKRLENEILKLKKMSDKKIISSKEINGFLEDYVEAKIGIGVTYEETVKIVKMANELSKLRDTELDIAERDGKDNEQINVKTPNVEYWEKREEVENYLKSLSPESDVKVLMSIGTKVAMLASLKSPLVNITGNSTQGLFTAIKRRLDDSTYYGLNGDLIRTFIGKNYEIYKKTGFDLSRMTEIEGGNIMGERMINVERGSFAQKKVKWASKYVLKYGQGIPDVLFASFHFADSLNLNSTSIAMREGLRGEEAKSRAREIMLDAMSIEPKTDEGKILRAKAIEEAMHSTFTDKTKISDLTLDIRKLMNRYTGALSVGDQIIPFAKTPANVVYANLKNSGVGLPFQMVYKLGLAVKEKRVPSIKEALNGLSSIGLSLLGVMLLASMFDPDDYVSEYADYIPKEKELIELKGATYNSIKIGNKWISLDYFGPLAATFVGYMNAKKYGENIPGYIKHYYSGVIKQALKIPGFNELSDTIDDLRKAVTTFGKGDFAGTVEFAGNGLANYAVSRSVPAILGDVATAFDEYEREATTPGQKLQRKIPGMRDDLKQKMTLFGEDIKTTGFFSSLAFGSRVKNATKGNLVDEINALDRAGQLPSISKIQYTSTRVKELKSKLGDDVFYAFIKDFGQELNKKWSALIETNAYQKASPEKKREAMEKIKNDILDKKIKKIKRENNIKKD